MIKILHVISDKNIGGAGKLLLNLLSGGDGERFCFSVAVPVGSLLAPRLRALSVEVIESDMSIFSLVGIIRAVKPHVVHTHAAAEARVAARLCGVRVTVNTRHCADCLPTAHGIGKRMAVRLFDALFTSCTVATAHYVRRVLREEGIPDRKIVTILNGSRPLACLSDEKRAQVRRALGYSERDVLVGMVARLEKGKGHEYFIQAASICRESCPSVKFLIAGNGTMERELKKLAKGLDNLSFLGFVDDVTEIMNILDMNVNCSYISETSSLSLSESMSVGAVPVVSDCGGNAFMAKGCGVIVPPKDSRALALAIMELAASDAKRAHLSTLARARFAAEFDAARMAEQTENLYMHLTKFLDTRCKM